MTDDESKADRNSILLYWFVQVCQVDPGHFRECDSLVRELRGTLEVASMAVQGEGEGGIDEFNDDEEYNIAHTSHAGKDAQILLRLWICTRCSKY